MRRLVVGSGALPFASRALPPPHDGPLLFTGAVLTIVDC